MTALRTAAEIAAEQLAELRAVIADPSTEPTVAEQARIHAAMLEHGLAKVAAAATSKNETRLRAMWLALIKAHRATGKPRPKLLEVAEQMGWNSEQPLRDYCRDLGVKEWHDVHPIVAAAAD